VSAARSRAVRLISVAAVGVAVAAVPLLAASPSPLNIAICPNGMVPNPAGYGCVPELAGGKAVGAPSEKVLTRCDGNHHVVVQAEPDAAESARRDLFGDDRVVPEVRVAAAVLLGHRHAEEALPTGLEPHAAVDDLVPFPLLVVGRHMAVQERPEGLAEQIVLGFEQRALVLDGTAPGGPPVSGTCAKDIPTGWLVCRGPPVA